MLENIDKKILSQRITDERKKIGLTQAQLAEQAKVTPAAISQIEKGSRTPTIPVLNRIANILGVSIDYLAGKTDTSELEDLLQHDELRTFFRGFKDLKENDKKVILNHIEFLRSKYQEGQKE